MTARLRRDDRGVAALEFALIAPLLLLLIYGAISFGLALSVKHVMTESAAEGARAAIGAQPVGAETQNAAYVRVASARATASLGVYSTYAQVTPTVGACAGAVQNTCVTVTVTYPYGAHPIVPNAPLMGLAIPASLSSTFQVQVSS